MSAIFSFSLCEAQQIFHKGYKFSSSSGRDVEVLNNGYLILGTYFIAKIDLNGTPIWYKWYYKPQNTSHVFRNVKLMIESSVDTSIILSGNGKHPGVSNYCYLLKLDLQGNKIWDYTFQDPFNNTIGYFAQQILIDNEKIYVIGGELLISGIESMFLFCIDKSGNFLWGKKYNLTYNSYGLSLSKTYDNKLLITGTTDKNSNSNSKAFLLKTNLDGVPEFGMAYGGNVFDAFKGSIQFGNGDLILVGNTQSFSPPYDKPFILKTDSIGNIKWCKVYDYDLNVNSISCFQNNIIINTHAVPNIIIADTSGNIIKSFYTGGSVSYGMYFSRSTLDNGFISVASIDIFSQKYLYVFKSDSLAGTGCYSWPYTITELFWQPIVEPVNFNFDTVAIVRDSGFVINNYPFQTYTLCSTATELEDMELIFDDWKIFPQPATDYVIIQNNNYSNYSYILDVFDITGKCVFSQNVKTGEKEIKIQLEPFSEGLYFVKLISMNGLLLKNFKIIKTK